jgi:hypothetical protein
VRCKSGFLDHPICVARSLYRLSYRDSLKISMENKTSYVIWKCSSINYINESSRTVMCKGKGHISLSYSHMPRPSDSKGRCITRHMSSLQSCTVHIFIPCLSGRHAQRVSLKPRTQLRHNVYYKALGYSARHPPPAATTSPLVLTSNAHSEAKLKT